LIRELPNTPQFRAAADPKGGGVGVRVTQNGDAAALAAYMATVMPYDYSWQPGFGNYSGYGNSTPYKPVSGSYSKNKNSFNEFVAGCDFFQGCFTPKLAGFHHTSITEAAALRSGYTPEQAKFLAQQVLQVDDNSQGIESTDTLKHLMRGIDPDTGKLITVEQLLAYERDVLPTKPLAEQIHALQDKEPHNQEIWNGFLALLADPVEAARHYFKDVTEPYYPEKREEYIRLTIAILASDQEKNANARDEFRKMERADNTDSDTSDGESTSGGESGSRPSY
jgi:hypothetical protein